MPASEVEVDAALVCALLTSQYGPVAPESVAEFSRGWDNAMFRLGDDLLVRMPVRRQSAPLIANEARWLPVLGPRLPIRAPEVVFTGQPGAGYPWQWTVQSWIEGEPLATLPVPQRRRIAAALAETCLALHTPADPEAPANPFRGVALAERTAAVAGRRTAVRAQLGAEADALLWDTFRAGVEADRWPGEPAWVHGDPHPFNLVQSGGELVGLIDFGDVTSGDPASDLATAWWSLDSTGRNTFVDLINTSGRYDPAVWTRARAWAASFTTAVATDAQSRDQFAPIVDHTLAGLAGPECHRDAAD